MHHDHRPTRRMVALGLAATVAGGWLPGPGRAAVPPPIPWESWTELRLAADGREKVLARRKAPALADLVTRIARAAQSTEAMGQPVRESFELSTRGTLLGLLEVGDDQARWLPPAERGPSRTTRLDAATRAALRRAVQRELSR